LGCHCPLDRYRGRPLASGTYGAIFWEHAPVFRFKGAFLMEAGLSILSRLPEKWNGNPTPERPSLLRCGNHVA